jgi:hypothetical protein
MIGRGTISARAPQRSKRKDAKDGATKQGRASANSDDCKRERIPQPGGGGRKRESAHAHVTIKQGILRIVKKPWILWE